MKIGDRIRITKKDNQGSCAEVGDTGVIVETNIPFHTVQFDNPRNDQNTHFFYEKEMELVPAVKEHFSHSKEEQTAQSLRVYQVAMRLQHSHGLGMLVQVEEGDTDYITIKVDEKVGDTELFWNFDVQNETWQGHLTSDMGDTIGHCETGIQFYCTDIGFIAEKIAEAVKNTFKTFPLVTSRHDKQSGRLTLFKWNPEGGGNFAALTINTSHVSDEESYVGTIEKFITLVNGLCPS